ncbi:hypothetical protein AALA80_17695 [Oscillospiraceae bacterium 50-60]
MGNIFTDIATAVKVTGKIREARKAGADAVRVKPIRIMPVAALPLGFLDVMEGCSAWNLGRETYQAVKEVFESLPDETKRDLANTPERPGEWVERSRFWQQQLRPALPPKMYHTVMLKFISWYIHCLKRRMELHEDSL